MSYSDRRAINVYVHAASQPVRQRKLAKFFTTIFHLIYARRPAPFLTSFYGNNRTKFPKIAERRLSQALSSPLEGQYGKSQPRSR